MPQRQGLFPGFFLGGYECSSHINRTGERQDLLALTQHDSRFREDYERVVSVGIRTVREGLRWSLCDQGGRHDFSTAAPRVEAAQDLGILQIWDLFHYGYPDDLDPLDPSFVSRFGDFAYAFARWYSARVEAPRFYAPVNEPSYFAWAAGEVGWFAPFITGRGWDLKVPLIRAALKATDAIRAVDPHARLLSVDPIIHTVPPADEPGLAEDSARFNQFQYQAWDVLTGSMAPELGGSPDYLDVMGVNCYLTGQWEHCREGHLALDDPRRKPFREMLVDVWERYSRPIVVTETSCWGEMRPVWLRYIVDECIAALRLGVDLQGICLYPIVDMPDWHHGHFIQFGLWDLVPEDGTLQRVICEPYLRELRRSQARLRASGLLPRPAEEAALAIPQKLLAAQGGQLPAAGWPSLGVE